MSTRPTSLVPQLDPVAVARWRQRPCPIPAWLPDEVGHRMVQRLSWIRLQPTSWVDWLPQCAGQQSTRALQALYAGAPYAVGPEACAPSPHVRWPWLSRLPWLLRRMPHMAHPVASPTPGADMLWANMALHLYPNPVELMHTWLSLLKVDGFVMCSGLGPDTLKEVREVYAQAGWPPPMHPYTDMHDWGDMLVQAGFAEPVMDMERITLAYDSTDKLLQDLRQWGRNWHSLRSPGLRGRRWHEALKHALAQGLPRNDQGQMTLTIEVIYGHAYKPAPRPAVRQQSEWTVDEMRDMLKRAT